MSWNSIPLTVCVAGCAGSSGSQEPVWECVGHGICGEPGQEVLYGWGKNAPAMVLPPGVGFHVGEGSAIHSLVLQVISPPWCFVPLQPCSWASAPAEQLGVSHAI